jgi:general secretion pathway protein A
MYLQFYGFKEAPFNLTPDSKFLFLSHRHQEALAALLFGVQERKGFILLTGDIGCGKTTLCRAMLSQLDPEQVKICVVLNSYLTDLELLKTINEGFGLAAESESKKTLLDTLNEYLVKEFGLGHNVVLIIDEAQNLRPETLEQIRMISNLETETAKLIQIMLVGQPELRRTLALPELEQLNQRITVRYHITPLEEAEIPDYVKHRLAVAEPQVEITLSPQAYRLIFHYSKGVPRRINVICDRALLVGYIQGSFNLDDKLVQRAVNEVRGESGQFSSAAGASSTASGIPGTGGIWIQRLGIGLAYLIFFAGCIGFGAWLYSRNSAREPENISAAKTPTAYPSPTPQVPDRVTASPTPAPSGKATATPQPTQTPKPTPTPSPTPLIFDNWQTDPESILRVRSESLAEAAAYINLVRRWDIIIDMPLFQNTPPQQVAQFDMLAMVKQLNFSAFSTDQISEALRLDMPVLVSLGDGQTFAPWVVINSVAGEVFEVIDPIRGRLMINRAKLTPLVKRAIVLYKDPDGFATITGGEKSDRVLKLQRLLATQGYFEDNPDGRFGAQTREALQKLQQKLGLEQTGRLDGPTSAAVSSLLTPRRPRLYS